MSIASPFMINRQAEGFLKRPSAKRGGHLLNLSRNQRKIMAELQTGHSYLKGHQLKMGLIRQSQV
jgi:hypothetical protein